MALRSQIGSSLVAKANPASPIRKTQEAMMENPAIPGKAEPGTLGRAFVEQPFLKPIPEGSARTVSVTPSADSASISSPTAPVPTPPDVAGGMIPGVGSPGAPQGQPQIRSGASTQPLFQGGVSPGATAAPVARSGVAAKGTSMVGANQGAINPRGQIMSPAVSTQAEPQSGSFWSGIMPTVSNWLGGKVSADTGQINSPVQKSQPKNISQAIVGTLLPNNAKAQAYATSNAVAKSGQGSLSTNSTSNNFVSQSVNNIATAIRSLGNSATNKLRSLFGW